MFSIGNFKEKGLTKEEDTLAFWLSAALDDKLACNEFKVAIVNWLNYLGRRGTLQNLYETELYGKIAKEGSD